MRDILSVVDSMPEAFTSTFTAAGTSTESSHLEVFRHSLELINHDISANSDLSKESCQLNTQELIKLKEEIEALNKKCIEMDSLNHSREQDLLIERKELCDNFATLQLEKELLRSSYDDLLKQVIYINY